MASGIEGNVVKKRKLADGLVKIAFIGCGDISTLHAKAVAKTEGAHLVGLWNYKKDEVSAGGQAFSSSQRAEEYGCRLFDSVDELVNDPNIDAVYILTNMETHLQYAMLAMKAGKHVLVEKPVGATLQEIQEMQQYAETQGLICMPGHNYIYEDGLRRMRDMIETSTIGKVTQLYIMYNIHHPEHVAARYPGVIRQIMTHHAYTSLYLAGEKPVSVSGMKATINDGSVPQENLAVVMMQMQGGAVSVLQTSFANDDHGSDPWSFYIKVLGTQGSARYSYNDFVDNRKHIVHSHSYQAYPYTIDNECEYFVNQCIRKGKPPLSTMNDAATALQILEAAEKSIAEGIHVKIDSPSKCV